MIFQQQLIGSLSVILFLVALGFLIYGLIRKPNQAFLHTSGVLTFVTAILVIVAIVTVPTTCENIQIQSEDYGYVKTRSQLIVYSSDYNQTYHQDIYLYNNIDDTTKVDVYYQKCYNILGSNLEDKGELKAERKQ